VIAIDLICEACGEPNPPGTQFCRNCNEFLAWDKASTESPPTTTTSTAPTVPVTPVVTEMAPISQQQTVPIPVPVDQSAGDQSYVDQTYVDQTYVDQTYVDQTAVDQGYTDQGYVEQAYTEMT
jgi:hypothetical protein